MGNSTSTQVGETEPTSESADMDVQAVETRQNHAMSAITCEENTTPTKSPMQSLLSNTNTRDTHNTRRVNAQDIRNIFRGSTTTSNVSMEQIERIKRMHDKISDGVDWDFNYTVLIIVASIVAAIGLATDSATTVISSMLLSPIMGPVLGMAYGMIIWDVPLIKRSMKNELLSILLCIVLGLIASGCCAWTDMAKEWPTNEMLGRGSPTTFYAGIPIAFFSGLGVALSVVDDSTSSLVGVAISASLLPPAVNCGMLLFMAIIHNEEWITVTAKYMYDEESFQMLLKLEEEDELYHYIGLLSLALTVVNVIMVAVGAAGMFRLKEVLPVKKTVFWDDLKIARRIYTGRALDEITGGMVSTEAVDSWQHLQMELKRRGVAEDGEN